MALFIKKNGSLQQVAIGHEVSKPEQQKSVSLDLVSGDQIVTPIDGQVLTQVTIKKPETLVAGNIKKDVNIGGVVGTYQVVDYLENRINGATDTYSYTNSDVTTIRQYAFYNDANIVSVSLPNVVNLGANSFTSCSNLTTVNLPSITTLTSPYSGSSAFSTCPLLSSVNMTNLITNNGGTGLFGYCSNLKSISLPNFVSITNATGMFYNTGLLSIDLPSLTTIGNNCDDQFGNCSDLVTVNLPVLASATRNRCFQNCTSLTTINLGKATSISQNCFYGCTSLTDITLGRTDAICSLSNVNAFSGITPPVTIHVPSDLIATYQSASNWATLYNNGDVTFVAIQ